MIILRNAVLQCRPSDSKSRYRWFALHCRDRCRRGFPKYRDDRALQNLWARALKIFLDRSYTLDAAKEKLKELEQFNEIVTFRNFIEESSRRGITRV